MGKFPIAFQRGTVNNLFVGRHLFPDRKFRVGENPVLGGDVLYTVIKFLEITAGLNNIAAGGKMAALVDGNCYGTSGNVLVNQPYPSFP